ncbi:MAG: hypothetical protein V4692_14075, partial [Bdellovibrionota bacterium]
MQKRSKLNVYLPFVFSRENDPTSIFTVGDQVLAEHLYSFHARSTIKHGFENFASIVEIDADTDTVHITPKFDISRANGTRLSSESFCRSIKRSMEGTLHAPYRSLVRSVECNEKKFSIQYKRLPANLRSLFTLPDFSVFDVDSLPLTSKNGKESTG